jgi:uncharacterized protein with HEPN domain
MHSEAARTRRRLGDIIHNIALAQSFVSALEYEEFRDDPLRVYAVTRCLEIISEASRNLPSELKARHPSIPWRNIAGAGNIYRHNYEDVAAHFLWATLQKHLPALRAATEAELAALDPGGA